MAILKALLLRALAINQSWIRTDMSSTLEPKFGWGHEEAMRNYKEALAVQIEQLEISPDWRPNEVVRYVAKLVRNT